ncbi:uncharacterized small protein (DUF1192 family) [Pseudaminobacter salicylatoxidans]|uniref:Uncharacterized small protein (DUF1192 family) n=1 Tax=Pseudaminobacter salicylatoxidans TaxID=93369 RepID=A0A316C5M9_PSESE|nr:DUF1192 domain-containing protein [Pseudaminobacter salicylatoxidans]PWJ85040.1 uncharacterized small protein (DUF1192 family) [Pseudaminobacter salicylatoxidans]
MALFDDEPKKPSTAYVVGQDVSLMSVADLARHIEELKAEIGRLEAELKTRDATKNAAESLFRR